MKTKSVWVLNTWTDEKVKEGMRYLEEGYDVLFGSTCTGHTLAKMLENQIDEILSDIYESGVDFWTGKRKLIRDYDEWGFRVYRLVYKK